MSFLWGVKKESFNSAVALYANTDRFAWEILFYILMQKDFRFTDNIE